MSVMVDIPYDSDAYRVRQLRKKVKKWKRRAKKLGWRKK